MLWVDTLSSLEGLCRDMEDSAEVSAVNSEVQGNLKCNGITFSLYSYFWKPHLPDPFQVAYAATFKVFNF